jgi:hypothetical protein
MDTKNQNIWYIMSDKDFIVIINKMLVHIPDNDKLKIKLQKLFDKYLYTAPEKTAGLWDLAHDVIMKRFDQTNLPDWALTILNIWANKE